MINKLSCRRHQHKVTATTSKNIYRIRHARPQAPHTPRILYSTQRKATAISSVIAYPKRCHLTHCTILVTTPLRQKLRPHAQSCLWAGCKRFSSMIMRTHHGLAAGSAAGLLLLMMLLFRTASSGLKSLLSESWWQEVSQSCSCCVLRSVTASKVLSSTDWDKVTHSAGTSTRGPLLTSSSNNPLQECIQYVEIYKNLIRLENIDERAIFILCTETVSRHKPSKSNGKACKSLLKQPQNLIAANLDRSVTHRGQSSRGMPGGAMPSGVKAIGWRTS